MNIVCSNVITEVFEKGLGGVVSNLHGTNEEVINALYREYKNSNYNNENFIDSKVEEEKCVVYSKGFNKKSK